MKSLIDLWANFLFHEKLDPKQMNADDILELIYLCEVLAEKGRPKFRPYKERLVTRRLIINTALDEGIDLIDLRHKATKKSLIGRGLLDIWLVLYASRYGSTEGTRGEWEAKRRNVKIRLSKTKRIPPPLSEDY